MLDNEKFDEETIKLRKLRKLPKDILADKYVYLESRYFILSEENHRLDFKLQIIYFIFWGSFIIFILIALLCFLNNLFS